MDVINFSYTQFLGFYCLIFIPLGLLKLLNINLKKDLLIAITRMSLQLIIIGLYLQTLFKLHIIWLNFILLFLMILFSALIICKRTKVKFKAAAFSILLGNSIALIVILPFLLIFTLNAKPWWGAQYMIPIAGMILGNSLTVNVIALDKWYTSVKEKHNEYQFFLAIGTKNPNLPFIKQAVKSAIEPQIANMMGVGIVFLPGIMTGQILSGTSPLLAVKYQSILFVAIFTSAMISVCTTLFLLSRDSFDNYGRLRW